MLNNSSDRPVQPSIILNKGTATFADNVVALSAGSAIAFGILILASPITSRLFGPQEFGLAALFMSGATILGSIACLRYEMAIVLPKKDKDAASLFVLCGMILIVTTTLTATFSLLLGPRILSYLGVDELKPYLWLFPIYVILIGMQFLLRIWHTRYRRFRITKLIRPHLQRPVGRPPKSGVKVKYVNLEYQAGSWDRARRVVGKIEWHFGELFARYYFIVT